MIVWFHYQEYTVPKSSLHCPRSDLLHHSPVMPRAIIIKSNSSTHFSSFLRVPSSSYHLGFYAFVFAGTLIPAYFWSINGRLVGASNESQ